MTSELMQFLLALVALGAVLVIGLVFCNSAPTKSRDADFRRFLDRNIPPRKRK